ncbi:hypothetical protein MHB54_00925 [Paenibacillus sp. FSL M7-0802]|uniref:hypothetical protein n=1 Tax=Paenibacillus sp. FSL M7-0802 TaxID=2921536 RepID=UPI0030F6C8AE
MWYGDKQEARVKIAMALVQKGWKIYGFKNDESDAMIDYFSPADWDGIAEKNGFVLCIDQNNLRYSGYEQKEYICGNAVYKTNDRIKKLEAMMNDAASSENEKASCAVLIEKEKEKVGAIEKYKVVETYPKFSFANPRGTSWHIEKDGQIIAKGKGVFAVNDYDWENKEKTEKQQKAEKVEALINRFEKVIKNTDALQAEVIQVPVTVTKEIEKTVTEVTGSDIKDGFTFIMKVGYTHGKYKGNKYTFSYKGEHYNAFAQLTKNNKPSTSMGKSWSLTVDRLNELLKKGHIVVIEFVEVTEYKEKTVYRKTARKQTVSNVPTIATDIIINEITEEFEVTTQGDNTNVIYHSFKTNEKDTEDKEMTTNSMDSVFSKFDSFEISNDQRISSEDMEFCQEQERTYKAVLNAYVNFKKELDGVSHSSFYGVMSNYDYEKSLLEIRNSFINNICFYFQKNYNVTINGDKVMKGLDFDVTHKDIVDIIFIQLDGFTFNEKAEKEIKDATKEMFKHGDKITLKNGKLVLDGYFAHFDSIWREYRLSEKVEKIFKSLQLFDNGSLTSNEELKSKYCGYDNSKKIDNYERYSPSTLDKVKSIKFFKNGKMEIEFDTHQQARAFATEYCGYKKVAV